jgi:hypothetical protein
MILGLHWATADHCGGALYGPYTRKMAFDIQRKMRYKDICDRQDVYLAVFIGTSFPRGCFDLNVRERSKCTYLMQLIVQHTRRP